MSRVLVVGFILIAACGNKSLERSSLCGGPASLPGCTASCAGATPCPAGYHCATGDKCDAVCTQTGHECGDGAACTADGYCAGGGDPPGDGSCSPVHVTAASITPTVQLLIDQSGSMNSAYGNLTRWEALRAALIDPVNGVVAKLAQRIVFGATLYSSKPGLPCPILTSQPRMLDNLPAIQQLLISASPILNTPTPESINKVVDDLVAQPPAPGSPPIIVLATDGLPNTCALPNPSPTDQQLANEASVAAAKRAFLAGIRLYFLFVGNDAAGNHPQQMANAGVGLDPATGRATVYTASNPGALIAELTRLVSDLISCDVKLSRRVDPSAGPSGMVTLNGATLTWSADWALDPDGMTIHLLGRGCTMLKNATTAVTIDATFPCGS